MEEAQQDSGFVDALSFPLTILYVMNCLEKTPPVGTDKIFNIIMIGASEKAEQRVVQVRADIGRRSFRPFHCNTGSVRSDLYIPSALFVDRLWRA